MPSGSEASQEFDRILLQDFPPHPRNLEGKKDKKALSAIFDIHTRNKQLDKNLDKEALLERLFAKKMTGADIKHLVNEAHILSWNRCGIFEKMKNKTLQESDILKATITKEDFNNAMESMKNQQEKNIRKPIGF